MCIRRAFLLTLSEESRGTEEKERGPDDRSLERKNADPGPAAPPSRSCPPTPSLLPSACSPSPLPLPCSFSPPSLYPQRDRTPRGKKRKIDCFFSGISTTRRFRAFSFEPHRQPPPPSAHRPFRFSLRAQYLPWPSTIWNQQRLLQLSSSHPLTWTFDARTLQPSLPPLPLFPLLLSLPYFHSTLRTSSTPLGGVS